MIKYTPAFLAKLEDLIRLVGFELRYEKGNFKAGYCILRQQKVLVINKYFTLEGKINSLTELLRQLEIDPTVLPEKQQTFLRELLAEI